MVIFWRFGKELDGWMRIWGELFDEGNAGILIKITASDKSLPFSNLWFELFI